MKIILTGATGFAGGQALKACIAHPEINSIIVLSRRELSPDLASSSEVKVIIHKDFSTYPDTLIQDLSGAQACVWCVGGKAGDFPDFETAKRVQFEYTKFFAEICGSRLVSASASKEFRFVFCSGAYASRDLDSKLWFMQDTRRIKGMTELALIECVEKYAGFQTCIFRPGGILKPDAGVLGVIAPVVIDAISVVDLAKVMADVAVRGCEMQTLENKDIVTLASERKTRSKE